VMRIACSCALALTLLACDSADETPRPTSTTSATSTTPSAAAPSAAVPIPERKRSESVTLLVGGDVSFGRQRGQRLLKNPDRNDFEALGSLLSTADLRFINLECTISDQNGETQSPINKLVFTAPPPTAAALARAGIDLVSLANNHAWDYGKDALLETLDRLERAEVGYVGAGRTREQAYAPKVIEHDGFKLAFVAVTDVWNQELSPHPGREHIANAKEQTLVASIRAAKAIDGVERVVVSYHGGYEYVDRPHPQTRRLLRAAIDAGADAVIGHHPHVVQRTGFIGGKPILFSVGNLLMRMVTGKPWTEFGVLARLRFHRNKATQVELCPFRMFGFEPIPLASDPQRVAQQARFVAAFDRLLRVGAKVDPDQAAKLGAFGADGCAAIVPN
jgi:poly-gamma-glutamate capsule biosynthesis protein CapA/YwtB (metallophosphatase superfamily)